MEAHSHPVVIAVLVAGLLAGYGVAVPVGAVAAYLVALTARTSWKIGACAALGVATADGLYALIAAIGGSALAELLHPIVLPLHWASGLVLIALAVRGTVVAIGRYCTQRAAIMADKPVMTSFARAYLGFWVITMLNPTTVIYFVALVVGSQTTVVVNRPEQVVFVLAVFVASASWQLLLAGGGALLGRVLTSGAGAW